MDEVMDLIQLHEGMKVLDVACGTGLVSKALQGRVREITGLDIAPAMYEQARPYVDSLIEGPAENCPFPDNSFDLVICRQGIQFMDAPSAAAEMVRVARPGGKICLINLCAYSEDDRDEYFEILKLRNPARKNFFMRETLKNLLLNAGCEEVAVHDYVSMEDVDYWSNTQAISDANREAIREVYRNASSQFLELHRVENPNGSGFLDNMLFGIAIGAC